MFTELLRFGDRNDPEDLNQATSPAPGATPPVPAVQFAFVLKSLPVLPQSLSASSTVPPEPEAAAARTGALPPALPLVTPRIIESAVPMPIWVKAVLLPGVMSAPLTTVFSELVLAPPATSVPTPAVAKTALVPVA